MSAYLDLAENRANRQILMKMTDWNELLDGFLELANYPILTDKGKVGRIEVDLLVAKEYEKFRVKQDKKFQSDFDLEIKKIVKTK